ncbi:MAG: glycosyltransferase family 2 protein [Candidatus Omnitrophica bacterium]|nr:glycosyltransferase family 2 protein [Candidatus Omnitrophota bacterium]
MDIYLSVVIPAYNEEKNIGDTLREISGFLSKKDYSSEVIVVDDGSGDGTFGEACSGRRLFKEFKVLRNEVNKGKGYTVRKGIMASRGDVVLFMDADNSTSISEIDKFLGVIKHSDIAIGTRRERGSQIIVPEPLSRVMMGQVYILLSRIIFGCSVRDLNCGFKLFRSEAAKKLFSAQKMDDWSFDTEVLFLAEKFKLRVTEVPVKWEHKLTSKVKPLRDGIRSFKSLVMIKMADLRGEYSA